jgi:hypothetical protein
MITIPEIKVETTQTLYRGTKVRYGMKCKHTCLGPPCCSHTAT